MEVIIGKIVNTYGLKGALKVYSMTDFASKRYKKGAQVMLFHPETKEKISLKIANYASIKGMDVITFKDLNDINLVEKYIGYEIHVDIKENDLPEDTYYYKDLLESKVYLNDQQIGVVIGLQDCGNQHNLRIQKADKTTFLYPFINHFLEEVDPVHKKIVLKPIKGMIPDDKN